MVYSQLVIADDNVVRFWPAAQLARPQLLGVRLRSVLCYDTLTNAFEEVDNGLDFVLASVLTGFLVDEGCSTNIAGSCQNILETAFRPIYSAAKKSPKVQVRYQLVIVDENFAIFMVGLGLI